MAQMPGSVVVVNLSGQKPYTGGKLSGRVHVPDTDQQDLSMVYFLDILIS